MRPPVTIFPPSVRRALAASAAAPQPAALSFTLAYRPAAAFQCRRYSSSKPSSPDDGPRDIAARQAVPSSGRSKGEKKQQQQQPKQVMPQPPSVPSTRHIGDEGRSPAAAYSKTGRNNVRQANAQVTRSGPLDLLRPPPTHLSDAAASPDGLGRYLRSDLRPAQVAVKSGS